MEHYLLKLYVTGLTTRSRRAIAALRRFCDAELAGRYELVVVDVFECPELAEGDKVLATPTVIKTRPEPERRIIGDLSDPGRILSALDLQPSSRATATPAPEAD